MESLCQIPDLGGFAMRKASIVFTNDKATSGGAWRRFVPFWLLLVAPCASIAQGMPADRAFVDLVRKSGLIFKGTVREPHAATPTVPVEENTAIVRVDEVLEAPASMGDLAGQDVTVRLLKPEAVKAGSQLAFFTVVYSMGSSVGVAEIGSRAFEGSSESLRNQIREARQELADEALGRRLASAELVVVGKVTETHPTSETANKVPSSEHDPMWWEAVLQVESVAKGQPVGARVTLFFPQTFDQRWGNAPKFQQGQEGIFLLHAEESKKYELRGYTALDAQDFQPKNQLDRIHRLLAKSQ
jgi:hypothetical protein